MSTSDLYHLWGVREAKRVTPTNYGKDTKFHVEFPQQRDRCPDCGSPKCVRHGAVVRELRAPQVGATRGVKLICRVPIVECKKCGCRKQLDISHIAKPKKTYTNRFANDVISLVRSMSVEAVAKRLGVSWKMVGSILRDYLTKKYPRRIKGLRRIAIDETSIGKNHQYVTIVLDLDTGEPVFVGDGKSEAALGPFWEMLGRRAKRIKCVAMDMGGAYQAAVRNNIPQAIIVFDRFHVVKLVNKYLDDLRKAEFAALALMGVRFSRGLRYALLKNPCNLVKDQAERLSRLLEVNEPLNKMYILKEDIRRLWEMTNREEAEAALDVWLVTARNSGVRIIERLAETIAKYRDGILNYFQERVSSGPLEGLNNLVKALIRRGFGYRNKEFLKLLILAICEFSPRKSEQKPAHFELSSEPGG